MIIWYLLLLYKGSLIVKRLEVSINRFVRDLYIYTTNSSKINRKHYQAKVRIPVVTLNQNTHWAVTWAIKNKLISKDSLIYLGWSNPTSVKASLRFTAHSLCLKHRDIYWTASPVPIWTNQLVWSNNSRNAGLLLKTYLVLQ